MMKHMDNQLRELQVEHAGEVFKFSARLRPDSNNLIIFLHGWGGAKECFSGAFESDALKDYGICTVDFLGFGESDKPENFSYDLLDQATIVAEAVNSLGAKNVYLVGHSMGGGIGLLAAPLVQNLVVFISAEGNLAPKGSGMDAQMTASQPFWLFKISTLPVFKLLLRLHPKRSIREWARWYSEASPLGLYRSIRSLVSWSDSRRLLPLFDSLPHKAYFTAQRASVKGTLSQN